MTGDAATKPIKRPLSLIGVGDVLARSIVEHERVYLLVAVAAFGLRATYRSLMIPLWFDEFFTLFLSRLSSLSDLLHAMPADGQPPLQYFLTHASLRLFGETEFGLRLPEVLAYVAVGLLTYRIVRKHGTAVESLFALMLVMGAVIVRNAACTARPYCLLLAFTTFTFACWQEATLRENHRGIFLCGVSSGLAGAILSHHYGVIHVGLFLLAGEVTRVIQRRRLDMLMLLSVAIGLLPLAFTVPLAHQSRLILGEAITRSPVFWAKPRLAHLLDYIQFVSLPLLSLAVMAVILIGTTGSGAARKSPVSSTSLHVWVAGTALAFLYPVQLILARLTTDYFHPRYAISSALGLALLCVWTFQRRAFGLKWAQALAVSTVIYLCCFILFQLAIQVIRPAWTADPASKAVSPLITNPVGDLPIVVTPGLSGVHFDFLAQWWYSPPEVRQRLMFLYDLPQDLQLTDFLGEISMDTDRKYMPFPIYAYSAFIENHSQFLLICSKQPEMPNKLERLMKDGWGLQPIADSKRERLFLVTRQQ